MGCLAGTLRAPGRTGIQIESPIEWFPNQGRLGLRTASLERSESQISAGCGASGHGRSVRGMHSLVVAVQGCGSHWSGVDDGRKQVDSRSSLTVIWLV